MALRCVWCAVLIAAFVPPRVGASQGPRLAPGPAPWIAEINFRYLLTPVADAAPSGVAASADSARQRRTYWLEGGLIGGTITGLITARICTVGDSPGLGCYVFYFLAGGTLIGFPIGGIIGSRITKHDR